MDIGLLKRQIKSKQLGHFYVFTGIESKVQDIYLDKMAEISGAVIKRIESVSECYAQTATLFSNTKLYVCRDDMQFIKSDKALSNICEVLGDNILVLVMSNIDKRSKLYKQFNDLIVEFNPLSTELLYKYIGKEIQLSSYWLDKFIEVCENSYSRILIEIDKIKTYATAMNITYDKSLAELLQCGAIYTPPKDAIFTFVDCVLKRDVKSAYDNYLDCCAIGEPSLRLLTVLYSNFKKVLQVQSCTSKDIENSTGLSTWEIKCTRDKLDYYSDGEIVRILKEINSVEQSIKRGIIAQEIAMDYMLTFIFGDNL